MTSFPSTMCFVSSGGQVSRFVWRVGVLACSGGILRIDKLYSLVYVHEHNLESPWPYDVNRGKSYISLAVFWLHLLISSSRDRQLSLSVDQSVEKYSDGRIHKSEPERRNDGNVDAVYFSSSGEIFESVAQSLFTINKHTIANVCLYLCVHFRIMNVKKFYILLQFTNSPRHVTSLWYICL